MSRIYLSAPDVGAEERALLLDAFDSNWIAPLGPHVDAFEAEVARCAGRRHAAALSSGTAAIELALRLLGVRQGDTVIAPTFTFIGSIAPVVHIGAEPLLMDSETTTWNLDPALLEAELERLADAGRLPAAVIAVDLYGQCADYDRIEPICRRYEVPLIEDAAEAIGATWNGRSAGSFGDAAIFSFNGNKMVTTSGGGTLMADDPGFVARARHLATQARDPAPHYEHTSVGFNYRLSNLCAAVGRGQLRSLGQKVARRREIFDRYEAALGSIPGITFMSEASPGRSNRWLTVVLFDPASGVDREKVRLALEAADIEARPTWKPMHMQPAFSSCRVVGGDVAASVFDRGLCLPSGSGLSDTEVDRVADVVSTSFERWSHG